MATFVSGADEFIRDQRRRMTTVPEGIKRAIKVTAADTQAQAARLAPVKTGFLRRSVDIKVTESGGTFTGEVTGNAFNRGFNYGYAQENGTRFIKPNYFMKQAFDVNKSVFISRLTEVLRNG